MIDMPKKSTSLLKFSSQTLRKYFFDKKKLLIKSKQNILFSTNLTSILPAEIMFAL